MPAKAQDLLADETGTIRKKWKGCLPVALLYPNTYPLAVSNLGFQLVYSLLNQQDDIVCERVVYPEPGQPLRSLESNRPLTDFAIICISVSFEHDFPRLAGMLAAGGIEPLAADRSQDIGPGSPLVVIGGVAAFMNPEPIALFADLVVIGEAEPVVGELFSELAHNLHKTPRAALLLQLAKTIRGCYVPALYSVSYDNQGRVAKIDTVPGAPKRIAKRVQRETTRAAHSMQLSPHAELGMYMTELGRGCSRGCRFCAAGFIYRPPRLWQAEAIIAAIDERPEQVNRVGLLGMEMADGETLDQIAALLQEQQCSLSFSSLRADRISSQLVALLAESGLKSVAIAPDGASERLRRVINKGLSEQDLINAAMKLVAAGILHLKLYVMIGLPTETDLDLDELIAMLGRMREAILPQARAQGRMPEITLSVNSFVPKPWTPFQYLSYGGLAPELALEDKHATVAILALKRKIKYLRRMLKTLPNVRLKVDRPERVLEQAVFSRGDRRLAGVLLDMGMGKRNFKQAMKAHGLSSWQYAVRPRDTNEQMCWELLDHGITAGYLAGELNRAFDEKTTIPCDTRLCKRCGVCHA
jgi:radical SAM superfamily enzyme YgiQ (UPF0313 family)